MTFLNEYRRLFFFFFFKQKTAYEIRKGDWSSDVCSSDLAILSVVRLGRIIRAVRIIEVKPEKKWAMSGLLQPVDRVSDAFRCFAIDQAQISFLEFLRGEGIVIEIKTASQSPTAVEHKRADHSPRRISMLFESLREG